MMKKSYIKKKIIAGDYLFHKTGLGTLFFDSGSLGGQPTDISEIGTTDFSGPDDFDLPDHRGMDKEGSLDADAVGHLPNRERFGNASALLLQNQTFESLESFAVAFLDFDPNLDGVSRVKSGIVGLQEFFGYLGDELL